jgi:uncharacterized protein YyaL (SSP411 family)
MNNTTNSPTFEPLHRHGARKNALASEKSPYLLQHASNPVDWRPWGDEAFETAAREDKPIFLSIGYSTCHWCHVMERETFEDEEAAALMNETFVSVKVDREERPDVDHLYMTVAHMMTGSGGWPLSIIMTPDKRPFFAATYLPKETRMGRIGMMELAARVGHMWKTRRDEIEASAGSVFDALRQVPDTAPGTLSADQVMDQAYEQLASRFDMIYGGFGAAPKFPTPHNLMFLLRYWKRKGRPEAREMALKTLERLALGGVKDHVGKGFHRYSTDREWLVPHFEKMLYDQALLAIAYLEAFQATGNPSYGDAAADIFEYVLRDMTSPEGGFYSAEDADSEGEEGKFYVWTLDELRSVLGPEDAQFAAKLFNASPSGNFREESTGRLTGANILHLKKPLGGLAEEFGVSGGELSDRMESIRLRLFTHREGRIHPHKDDKILADWNGLMIAALAIGGRVLDRNELVEAATRAATFVLSEMRAKDGRLLHRHRSGESAIPGMLDDYAFMVWGLIELYQATFDPAFLESALSLTRRMRDDFWDREGGGFFLAPADNVDLPARKKELYDGALPSGNSVAALNLARLGRLTGRAELEAQAEALGETFAGHIVKIPSGYTFFLLALDFLTGKGCEICLSGPLDTVEGREMIRALWTPFAPNMVALARDPFKDHAPLDALVPYSAGYTTVDGKVAAYICRNHRCETPVTDPARVAAALREG